MEAKFYYAGLPSAPILVARTSITPWEVPSGPQAYWKLKELHLANSHPIKEVWEGNLAPKILALLDSMEVKWTSIDIVRIGDSEEYYAPAILWIGVMPASLPPNDGVIVASRCKALLEEHGITDVDVEIRESVVSHPEWTDALTPTHSSKRTVGVHKPLTTILSLTICAQSKHRAKGTSGPDPNDTEKLLVVTAQHIFFTPDKNKTEQLCKNDSQHCYNVTLFGDAAFKEYLDSVKNEIGHKRDHHWEVKSEDGKKKHPKAQARLNKAREAQAELNTFYEDILARWATPESRLLGHVILSPPINVGGSSSEDWAIIEIDPSKVDPRNFNGNAIDRDTHVLSTKFVSSIRSAVKCAVAMLCPGCLVEVRPEGQAFCSALCANLCH